LEGATAWQWSVSSVADGAYKLRVVPDGKETANKKQDEYPCFADGEAMPGTSAEFRVTRSTVIFETKDRFPPTSIDMWDRRKNGAVVGRSGGWRKVAVGASLGVMVVGRLLII
jgi:hypothetical protein